MSLVKHHDRSRLLLGQGADPSDCVGIVRARVRRRRELVG